MSLDLENQNIQDTFQRLVQVSGSNLVDGTGSVLLALKADNLAGNLSGSFEGTFTQGKIGDGIDILSGSTIFKSDGYRGFISASEGKALGGFVLYSGSTSTTLGVDTLAGTGFQFVSANDNSHIIFTDQNNGDLSIKTDKFIVENNGDITASNALFNGTAIARNFILASDTVVGPDSVGGSQPNFGQYMSGSNPESENDYALYLDGTQTDSNGTGSIINSVEFKLSEQANLTDIIVANESTLVNDKVNITIRNRADSLDYLGFNVKQSAGQLFSQEMSPGNVYTFEISFDNLGSKTITALTATDLTVPFTASNKGFQLLGDINQTGNITQTGTITTSGQIFTNSKISAGNSRPDSPSKTLHISSSINGDGIRVQGPNNPLIQASNNTGIIYSIGAITSADTQLLGSVAGDTTFRYANNGNPNGRLLFGSGSTTTPSLILGGTTARVTDTLIITGSDVKGTTIETNSITTITDTNAFLKFQNADSTKGVQTVFNNVTNIAFLSPIGTTQLEFEGTADTASYVETSQTASYVETAQTASYVETSQTASYVETAQTASYVETAQTASYIDATNIDGTITNASTSSYVETAQTASYIDATNVDGTVVSASYAATSSLSQTIEVTTVNDDTDYSLLFVANSGNESVLIDENINKLKYNPFNNELKITNIEVLSRLTIPGFTNVSASLAAINTTFDTGSFITSSSFNSLNSTVSLFNPDETFILDLSSLAGGAGGLAITASNGGSVLTPNARSFDFTGNAVTATNIGTAVTVDINTGSNDTTLQTVLDNGNSATQDLTLTGLLTVNGIAIASGSDNNSTGVGSGTLTTNTGTSVSAFGKSSLRNNTGNDTSGFGVLTLQNNTGNNTSGFGYQALQNNEGANSSGLGVLALQNNIGSNTSGVGHQSLQFNSGSYSSGFGKESLRFNKQSNASGFGSYTLMYNNGSRNTAIGFEAGLGSGVQELSNNDNTFLGAQTVFESSNIQNSTAVGANVALTDSNTVILGNNANVGIGTSSPSSKLEVSGNVTATSFTGSLLGTATTASYVETAQTASYVETSQTASFVTTAQTASYIAAASIDGTVTSASFALSTSQIYVTESNDDTTHQILFKEGTGVGYTKALTDGNNAQLTYNPFTQILTVGTIQGTLSGSALEAISSSYATTSSYTEFARTASYVEGGTIATASYVAGANVDGTVTSSLTASHAENAQTASYIDPSSLVGGSDTQIQFNDNGEFAGDSGMTFNKTYSITRLLSDSSFPSLEIGTTTTGTPSNGTLLGQIVGYSTYGSGNVGGIKWVGDGGFSINDYPTRLEFQTINDGGSVPSTKLTIKNDGKVGIGTTDPSQALEVVGKISGSSGEFSSTLSIGTNSNLNGTLEVNGDVSGTSIYASHNIVAYSDARSKTNITTIESALDKVDAIRGVTYNKVEDPNGIRYMGVIAQELQEILPEVVSEGEDGKLAVAYGNITGVLIEAIKELKAEIAELKADK